MDWRGMPYDKTKRIWVNKGVKTKGHSIVLLITMRFQSFKAHLLLSQALRNFDPVSNNGQ